MSSQGPNNPSSGASVDGANIAWSNPTNIYTSNNVYSTASITVSNPTQYLQATGFGFSIPSGATINGIVVKVEKKSDWDTTITDKTVKLIKGGTITGNNKASPNYWIGLETEEITTYGNSTDLWGTTWSDTDINASNFGIAFQAQSNDSGSSGVYVDHINITIYYTEAAAGKSMGFIF